MAKIFDLMKKQVTVIGFVCENNVSACQPEHVDNPKEILNKYARGLPISGLNGSYESDEFTDEQMEDSVILDEQMDRLQYLKDSADAFSEAQKRPKKAEKPQDDTQVPPKDETPSEA